MFLRPAVAGLLKEHFVEARIHVDIQSTLTDEQFAANHQLAAEKVQTTAMPTYAIVDPKSGSTLGIHDLRGQSPPGYEPAFIEFLQGFLQ